MLVGAPGCARKVLCQAADTNIAGNKGDLFLRRIGGILLHETKPSER